MKKFYKKILLSISALLLSLTLFVIVSPKAYASEETQKYYDYYYYNCTAVSHLGTDVPNSSYPGTLGNRCFYYDFSSLNLSKENFDTIYGLSRFYMTKSNGAYYNSFMCYPTSSKYVLLEDTEYYSLVCYTLLVGNSNSGGYYYMFFCFDWDNDLLLLTAIVGYSTPLDNDKLLSYAYSSNTLSTFNSYLLNIEFCYRFESDSYNTGYSTGFDIGYWQGYDLGYDEGEETGLEDGYIKGYEQGVIDENSKLCNLNFINAANTTIEYIHDINYLIDHKYTFDEVCTITGDFYQTINFNRGIQDYMELAYYEYNEISYNIDIKLNFATPVIVSTIPEFETSDVSSIDFYLSDSSLYSYYISGTDEGNNNIIHNLSLINELIDKSISSIVIHCEEYIQGNSSNLYFIFNPTLYYYGYDEGYNLGVHDGYGFGYDSGYDLGYDSGFNKASNEAYDNGYDEGFTAGDSFGYNRGISENVRDYGLGDLFLGIANTPIETLKGLFGFELFGVELYKAFASIITLLFVIWLIRRFI